MPRYVVEWLSFLFVFVFGFVSVFVFELEIIDLLVCWCLLSAFLFDKFLIFFDLKERIRFCLDNSDFEMDGLHYFFEKIATKEENDRFFSKTLPKIIELALELPELFPNCNFHTFA